MKRTTTLLLFLCFMVALSAQNNTIDSLIFIPHPRSSDAENQSSQDGIEPINFSLFDMILLGGDLTNSTTTSYESMDYCDSLYDLGSPNTLWTLGNHDMSNPEYITEYTGRPVFYAYTIQNITFAVLCTEIDVGDTFCYISGEQLEMLENIADTITESKYLIVMQHRLLWMIGDEYLETKLDSVGQSTSRLDTANFYEVVYPLLQQVKSKGIKIICLGGDRTDFNLDYSPEDSITYLMSTMVAENTDAQNHVIILTIDEATDTISWEFVALEDVEKNPVDTGNESCFTIFNTDPTIFYDPRAQKINVYHTNSPSQDVSISLFDLSGKRLYFGKSRLNDNSCTINWDKKGIFLIKIEINHSSFTQKIYIP